MTVADVSGIASAAQQMAAGARSVVDAMEEIRETIEQSTGATREISMQAGEVTAATQSIASIAEENSAATEEVLASAEEMSSQIDGVTVQAEELARTAEQLRAMVERFHRRDDLNTEDAAPEDDALLVARRRTSDWRASAHDPGSTYAALSDLYRSLPRLRRLPRFVARRTKCERCKLSPVNRPNWPSIVAIDLDGKSTVTPSWPGVR